MKKKNGMIYCEKIIYLLCTFDITGDWDAVWKLQKHHHLPWPGMIASSFLQTLACCIPVSSRWNVVFETLDTGNATHATKFWWDTTCIPVTDHFFLNKIKMTMMAIKGLFIFVVFLLVQAHQMEPDKKQNYGQKLILAVV